MTETLRLVLRWQGQRLGTGPDELERAAPANLRRACENVLLARSPESKEPFSKREYVYFTSTKKALPMSSPSRTQLGAQTPRRGGPG